MTITQSRQKYRTLNVQIFAGPGVGKSFTMARLFCELKLLGIPADMVAEYAKELHYDGLLGTIPQKMIVREQARRMRRLQGKVPVVITDAPVAMSLSYASAEERLTLESRVQKLTKNWECVNVLLHRDISTGYEQTGRYQSMEEALATHRNQVAPFAREYVGNSLLELPAESAVESLLEIIKSRLQ